MESGSRHHSIGGQAAVWRRRELPPCRSTRGGGLLRHDPHHVVQHLHEPAAHTEVTVGAASEPQLAVTEERHQRRMSGKDSDLSIVRARNYWICVALVQN